MYIKTNKIKAVLLEHIDGQVLQEELNSVKCVVALKFLPVCFYMGPHFE